MMGLTMFGQDFKEIIQLGIFWNQVETKDQKTAQR